MVFLAIHTPFPESLEWNIVMFMKRAICIFSLCMLLSACSDPMPQSGQASHTWGNGNTYVGEWKDGKPNGEGTATYVGLGQYVGTFKKGKRHGGGEANYVDGRKYVGEWKDGDPWEGEEYAKGGTVIATYSEGVSSDRRESVDSSSSVTDALGHQVVGVSESSLPPCMGTQWRRFHDCHTTYTWPNGDKYVGEWKDGKKHGQGTKTWASGKWKDHKYVGAHKEGKRSGQGTYTWPNGNKYVGAWKGGERTGQGTLTWTDGSKYVGEWKDSQRSGQGTKTWASGSKYVGEWKDGKRAGQGTYTWSSGNKYVGEYKDGKKHGQGTKTWASGAKYIGEYKDGKRWKGAHYDRDGKVRYTYSEGVRKRAPR